MPTRLVYSPKAFVYTKDAKGTIYNLSSFVTSGEVQRKVNQVSTATVTLRNPYKRFTTPSQGVAFHPEDPITIYLERVPGFPVRVFTGYLDRTPYYQLYPGTITLRASCTLKRLLYSYFDPSLPYMLSFFEKYGWTSLGTGTILSQSGLNTGAAATQADVNAGKKPFTDLRDGSLGKLLWATLYDIGQWQDSNIWIEELPTGANGIAARMAKLMQSMQADQAQASGDFTSFLQSVIGAGSQGSGGGNGGTSPGGPLVGNSNAQKIFNYLIGKGINKYGAAGVCGNAQQENNFATDLNSGGLGIFQWTGSRQTAAMALATKEGKPYTDLGLQLDYLWQELNTGYTTCLGLLKSATSASQAAIDFEQNFEHAGTPDMTNRIQYANDALAAFGNGAGVAAATATGTVNALANAVGAVTQVGSTAAPGSSSSTSLVFPLKQGTYVAQSSWTQDQGVDIATNGSACGTAAPLLAIAAGTVVSHGISGFGPDAPTLRLDTPIQGHNYVYYGHSGPDGAVPIGTHVTAGQVIGSVGCGIVGISSGPHLEIGFASGPGAPDGLGQSSGTMLSTLKSAVAGNPVAAGGTAAAGGGAGSGTSSPEAFVASLNFPSIEDQVVAVALGAEHKGLMHDQSLMPFVQQLTQASLRSFQSLPNGDFFAFYPDYFGEMGHHDPYWIIDDIEILSGGIDLSDDALATHVFAIGDNEYMSVLGGGNSNTELINELFSAGTINIFNAFLGTDVLAPTHKKGEFGDLMNAEEAVQFIKRYGARPLVQNYPQVRSPIFEMLLAYQQFMLAWSNQFKTPFSFTFMPELFPGGKVAFGQHGLQMYIDSVTHSWNYAEGGFTTDAELSAPSVWGQGASNPDLPPHMVQAMVEPVQTKTMQQKINDHIAQIVDNQNPGTTISKAGGTF